MKYGMLVTGPNASGKTTATQKALQFWVGDQRMRTVYADNSDRSAFKGTMNDMVELLLGIWESDAHLVVVEGTNRIATVLGRVIERAPDARKWSAHVAVPTSGAVMGEHIRRRCELLKKRYRDDYWVERVLDYESQRRYRNKMQEAFSGGPVYYYPIEADYEGVDLLRDQVHTFAATILGDPQIAAGPALEQEPVWGLF
jgi:hypothetical protein